jgi:glycerol-3-phosphate dehydrogenase
MKIAVIGGGLNGVMTAWELCKYGHSVTLFERHTLISQTSSASSKLLHGGLRYLENFEFRLVKEALRERQWWIDQAPHLAQPIKIFIPIYKQSRRPAWLYKIGLFLYDLLSGENNIGKHQKYNKVSMQNICPDLKTDNLVIGFSYYDGQMDEYRVGLWAADKVKKYKNFTLLENTLIDKVSVDGEVTYKNSKEKFEKVINITGPWASKLLSDNNIKSENRLDLVRGSHIVISRKLDHGYFLEVPNERRIFFVLPYQGQTLIGTTEVRQLISDEIKPTKPEIAYLIDAYNHYFKDEIIEKDVVKSFSGVRPLIKSANNANKATRGYAIQVNKDLISIFGGKWTTARQLSYKVANLIGRD